MTILRDIFLDRHRELRSPWRVLLFLILTSLGVLGLNLPLDLLALDSTSVSRAASILGVLLASYVMTRFIHRKPLVAIGLALRPDTSKQAGMGLLLGFLMMSGIFLVEFALGYAVPQWRGLSLWECARAAAALGVSVALGAALEELFFRGYLFQTLMQTITFLPAAVLVSAFFAVAHLENPNATTLGLVNIFLAGIWLSFAYLKSRCLWLPIALHFSWNFFETLFGFPTSGLPAAGGAPVEIVQSGPVWVGGGSFGPEAGVLATVALVISTWYIVKANVFRAPEGVVTLDSLEDLLPSPSGAHREDR